MGNAMPPPTRFVQQRRPLARQSSRSAFSLLELVIVVLVLTILAGVIAPRLGSRSMAARDARRLADLRSLRDAIDQYYLDHGDYPPAQGNASFGNWDVSHDGDFIPALTDQGYLRHPVNDPVGDATYHYRYYVYPKASYGCVGTGPFYVLAATHLESPGILAQNPSYFACSGRDWSNEFDYVTGGGAAFE